MFGISLTIPSLGTPRGTPRSRGRGTPVGRGTPRATDPEAEKAVKVEKVVKGVKKVAAAAKKTEKKVYKEMACQTSPGFIAKVYLLNRTVHIILVEEHVQITAVPF